MVSSLRPLISNRMSRNLRESVIGLHRLWHPKAHDLQGEAEENILGYLIIRKTSNHLIAVHCYLKAVTDFIQIKYKYKYKYKYKRIKIQNQEQIFLVVKETYKGSPQTAVCAVQTGYQENFTGNKSLREAEKSWRFSRCDYGK